MLYYISYGFINGKDVTFPTLTWYHINDPTSKFFFHHHSRLPFSNQRYWTLQTPHCHERSFNSKTNLLKLHYLEGSTSETLLIGYDLHQFINGSSNPLLPKSPILKANLSYTPSMLRGYTKINYFLVPLLAPFPRPLAPLISRANTSK